MAIVHVAFKSSSQAPPAAAHAQYIARDGQYERRGGVELVESGNMPEFAQADPFAFWVAADAHERANGRTYTELQIALPRELGRIEREQLAREATRELLGDRFAYTLAVHAPLAKDNIDQPHMHLMFSERAVDETTRGLAKDRFFKRNGAKKDPAWNDRNKPDEVREKWVQLMNGAMQRAGIEERMDARSYEDRGRTDLMELREPKLLGGNEVEARGLHTQVDELRAQRAELPPAYLGPAEAVAHIERAAEAAIVEVEERRDEDLGILDRLIAKAKELAARAIATAKDLAARQRRQAETAKVEAERREQKAKRIEERAEVLWQSSPGGQAERIARKQYDDTLQRTIQSEDNVKGAETALTVWNRKHWAKSLLFENVGLQAAVAQAGETLNAYRKSSEEVSKVLAAYQVEKHAALPALRERAAEDVKEVEVRLSREQAWMLIFDAYGRNREAALPAFAQVEDGTHSMKVLDGTMSIQKAEPEGFIAAGPQMYKPAIDQTIHDLTRAQARAVQRARQAEIERKYPSKGRGGYGE